jgi:uroporphyrinogen-III decarboxylase
METKTRKYGYIQEGYQRVEKAAKGYPDRVPLYAQLCERLPMELGVSAKTLFHDPELLTTGTFDVFRKYGIDVPSVDFDCYNIEAEAIGQKLIFHENIMPDIDRSHLVLASKKDLLKLRTPDFEKAGRCPMVVEIYQLVKKLTGLDVSLAFCAPFALAANLRGIEQLIIDTYKDPDFVDDLFNFIIDDLLAPWLSHLNTKFPDAPTMVGADATASLPIINLKIFEKWVVSPTERLRDIIGPKVIVPNQTGESYLKNPQELMDLRRRSNPKFIEGQDPDVEKLGPAFYKNYSKKHDLPLLLGIGASFLNQASPEMIENRIKQYINIGGKGGRLWLYLCNLSPSTPIENIYAAKKAIDKYGRYNI